MSRGSNLAVPIVLSLGAVECRASGHFNSRPKADQTPATEHAAPSPDKLAAVNEIISGH